MKPDGVGFGLTSCTNDFNSLISREVVNSCTCKHWHVFVGLPRCLYFLFSVVSAFTVMERIRSLP